MTERRKTKQGFPSLFFAIAVAWAWGFWAIPLATTRGWIVSPMLNGLRMFFLVVGAFAPFVAAFALSFCEGTAGALFKRAFLFRIPVPALLMALFLSPVLAGIAIWLRALQGGAQFTIQMGWRDSPIVLFFLFFLGGSFNEEFGWAYAIDKIQPRWGFVKGSLMLGILWACWHLPLFFMPTQSQYHMAFWTFVITCGSLRVLYVWTYDCAHKSVLVTLLFHTSVNFTVNLFALLDPTISVLHQTAWLIYTGFLVLSALLVGFAGRRVATVR